VDDNTVSDDITSLVGSDVDASSLALPLLRVNRRHIKEDVVPSDIDGGRCEHCPSYIKLINDLSTQVILDEDQFKSLERCINRYKVLLREDRLDTGDKIQNSS
jgi:hypothetical protein